MYGRKTPFVRIEMEIRIKSSSRLLLRNGVWERERYRGNLVIDVEYGKYNKKISRDVYIFSFAIDTNWKRQTRGFKLWAGCCKVFRRQH